MHQTFFSTTTGHVEWTDQMLFEVMEEHVVQHFLAVNYVPNA